MRVKRIECHESVNFIDRYRSTYDVGGGDTQNFGLEMEAKDNFIYLTATKLNNQKMLIPLYNVKFLLPLDTPVELPKKRSRKKAFKKEEIGEDLEKKVEELKKKIEPEIRTHKQIQQDLREMPI